MIIIKDLYWLKIIYLNNAIIDMAIFYLLPHQETVLDLLSYLIHSYENINL